MFVWIISGWNQITSWNYYKGATHMKQKPNNPHFLSSASFQSWSKNQQKESKRFKRAERFEFFWSLLGGILILLAGYALTVIFLSL
jgi:hypothetical protein